VVIFINQWREQKNHYPALIGVFSSIICLAVFGKSNFVIPSMVLILTVFALSGDKILKGGNL
jgi:predicted branched-subunit amino acid permease